MNISVTIVTILIYFWLKAKKIWVYLEHHNLLFCKWAIFDKVSNFDSFIFLSPILMIICRSIELNKVFLINNIEGSKAFTKIIDGSLKYVFIKRISKLIRKLTIDESFKAEASYMYLFKDDLQFDEDDMTIADNDIIMSYSYKYYYDNNYLNYITVNEKLNLDLESMSCK